MHVAILTKKRSLPLPSVSKYHLQALLHFVVEPGLSVAKETVGHVLCVLDLNVLGLVLAKGDGQIRRR